MEEILKRLDEVLAKRQDLEKMQAAIDAKQKELNALKGKSKAEIPDLDDQIKALEGEVTGLSKSYKAEEKKVREEFESVKAELKKAVAKDKFPKTGLNDKTAKWLKKVTDGKLDDKFEGKPEGEKSDGGKTPEGKPEEGKTNEGPDTPPSTPEGFGEGNQTRSNLPIRSFWEIYNDTCTEHVGSIARNINKLAHMKILQPKNEDIVHKILNVPLIIFKAPTKVLAKIPNAIMGTDRKINEMRDNIDDLTPEEFRVLVESPEKVNAIFRGKVKDTFDRDYLDPQFMKQYKVNNAYLDAVRERLGREHGVGIDFYSTQAEAVYERMEELKSIGSDKWTQEQQNEYNDLVVKYQRFVEAGKRLQAELDRFDEGAKKKSSAYRNISGWFLGRFNPDNREQNAKMAQLAKTRRIAGRSGDAAEVSKITGEMQGILRDNTDIRGTSRSYIDIGSYSIESPVEKLDRGPQTKGRLLLTDVALVSSVVGLFNQLRNRSIIEEHNRHLQEVNAANKEIKATGEAKVSDSPDAPQTEETIARQTVEAGWNRSERGDLDATGWSFNSAYRQRDLQSHTEGGQVAQDTETLLQQGNQLGALKGATEYYTRVQNANRVDIQGYIPGHPQYDYTAFGLGDSADMSKVYEFFANGVVPYETTVNGVMADLMPQLSDGLDLNGVIFAGANALYQAQREGKKFQVLSRRKEEKQEEVEDEGAQQLEDELQQVSDVQQEIGANQVGGVQQVSGARVVTGGSTIDSEATTVLKPGMKRLGRKIRSIKVMPDLGNKDDENKKDEGER